MRKKHSIEVRKYESGHGQYSFEPKYQVAATIKRVIRTEAIGNFCPAFATYKGKDRLVHSDEGDLSDPFRADESYLKTLFIEEK